MSANHVDEPRQRGWLRRHWLWLLVLVPLSCVGACGGGLALLFTFVFGAIKSSEPYHEGVSRAKASAALHAALGEPITEGFLPTGSINIHWVNGEEIGSARLSIPVSGPRGSATVEVVADKNAGKWTYGSIRAVIPGEGEPIDLLAGP